MSTFDSVLHITFPKRGNCAALVSSSVNSPAGAVGAQKPMVNIWVNLLVNPWCSRTTSKPDCQACTRGRAAFTFLSVDRFLYIQTLRALTFNHRKKTEQQKKSMWHHKRNPSWRLLVFSARPACPCMCPSSVLLCCNSCKKTKKTTLFKKKKEKKRKEKMNNYRPPPGFTLLSCLSAILSLYLSSYA